MEPNLLPIRTECRRQERFPVPAPPSTPEKSHSVDALPLVLSFTHFLINNQTMQYLFTTYKLNRKAVEKIEVSFSNCVHETGFGKWWPPGWYFWANSSWLALTRKECCSLLTTLFHPRLSYFCLVQLLFPLDVRISPHLFLGLFFPQWAHTKKNELK